MVFAHVSQPCTLSICMASISLRQGTGQKRHGRSFILKQNVETSENTRKEEKKIVIIALHSPSTHLRSSTFEPLMGNGRQNYIFYQFIYCFLLHRAFPPNTRPNGRHYNYFIVALDKGVRVHLRLQHFCFYSSSFFFHFCALVVPTPETCETRPREHLNTVQSQSVCSRSSSCGR